MTPTAATGTDVARPAVYKPIARALHWIVALLVIATIPVGQIMIQDGLQRSVQDTLFIFHKNVGVAILLLVVLRLAYRVANPAPPLPASVPATQRRIAGVTHALLYVLLLTMAISGYVRVRAGGFPIEALDAIGAPTLVPRSDALAETAKSIHNLTRFALVPLILLHVAGALYHGIVRRDGVLSRMLPSSRR